MPRSGPSNANKQGEAMSSPIAVLVMAYGGPNSLDEVPGYLADIRVGRPTPAPIVQEISHNYQQIGGKSPLLEITRRQVNAIASNFNPKDFRFYLGMRHWSPWIEKTIGDMLADGITKAVSLVMAPHFSKMSVAKYHIKIAAGLEMYRGHIEFVHIESYHNEPGLIQAFANRVKAGLKAWPVEQHQDVHVIFSAHSLPTRILKMGDLYEQQLHETARLVADKAGLDSDCWSWSYQSAGRSPEPWLGPQLPEHLTDLAGKGIRNVISVPVGFVCDHVEILYDIDIQAQQVAQQLGMRLVRPPALNDDAIFIETLANIIHRKAMDKGWIRG
jgi:protoporphyrin/coproporphyrin ferrochelatase